MFQIPRITKNLLIINIVCYFAALMIDPRAQLFGLHYFQGQDFHLFQFVTYMFMHGSFSHVFFNMFALWMFGTVVERDFGEKRFLIYYFVCGIGAGLCQELSQAVMMFSEASGMGYSLSDVLSYRPPYTVPTVGASGSIYGILLAFGMMHPEQRMFVFPLPVPLKAKWFVMIYAAIELLSAMAQTGDGVAHMAHIGGMFFGWMLIRSWRRHSSSFNGWDGYEIHDDDSGPSVFSRASQWLRNLFSSSTERPFEQPRHDSRGASTHTQDWDYNAQQRQREKEIDAILEKIRRSGYAALTDEEKRKLFDR